MVIFILEKASGAHVIKPIKLWHPASSGVTYIRPFDTQMIYWMNAQKLIVFSGIPESEDCDSRRNFRVEIKVDADEQTYELRNS
jgi:hypothetical protein